MGEGGGEGKGRVYHLAEPVVALITDKCQGNFEQQDSKTTATD